MINQNRCIITMVSLIMDGNSPLENSYLWFAGVVSLFTFVTNSLMIYGIYRTKQTNNPFTLIKKLYIVFGVFNFTAALNVLALHVMSAVKAIENLSLEVCVRVNIAFVFLNMILGMWLTVILLMITSLQYIAVTKPMQNKDIEHDCCGGARRKALWVFGLLVLTGAYAIATVLTENKLAMIVVPFLGIMVVAINCYLIYHLNTLAWKRNSETSQAHNNCHKHAVVTLLLITGTLIVFNLPNAVMVYYVYFKKESNIDLVILRLAEWAALFAVTSNGIYPFIYVVRNRSIKSFYKDRFTSSRRGTEIKSTGTEFKSTGTEIKFTGTEIKSTGN